MDNKPAPNQRLEPRILQETTIFVETYSTPAGEPKVPNIVISKTLDLSANGVQVVMDHPIPTGSILQLGVDFGGQPPRFHLGGGAGRNRDLECSFGHSVLIHQQHHQCLDSS